MKITRMVSIGIPRISYRWRTTFFVILLIESANACYADTNQIPTGISDILHHVELATVPQRSYIATVHQTVTRTNTVASTAMLASQPSFTEEEDYVVNCTTSGVIRPSKALSLNQLPQNTVTASIPSATSSSAVGGIGGGTFGGIGGGQKQHQQNTITTFQPPQITATFSTPSVSSASSASGGGSSGEHQVQQSTTNNSLATAPTNEVRLLMTVNPINTLRHIEQMRSGLIGDDVYQNDACYKISNEDGRFSFSLWVSKSDWSIRREIISRDATVLLDTQFEYKHWNGMLVPVHVVIMKPSNGTRVDQEYSAHTYSSTK